GLKQLVGYVVLRDGAIVDLDRLRLHLSDHLPAYMIPALIETVKALPRLPNGKLDRASLPKPTSLSPNRLDLKLPRNETESRILEAWNTLFHPQPVSVEDDFFLDLGGHSLLAARMVSELRKDPVYSRLSVADVYENPTISTLAAKLDKSSLSRTVPRTETALDNRLARAGDKGESRRRPRPDIPPLLRLRLPSPRVDDPVPGLLLSPTNWTFNPFICRVGGCRGRHHLSYSSRCNSCSQVARDRQGQSWPLPVVERVLCPLVVRAISRK